MSDETTSQNGPLTPGRTAVPDPKVVRESVPEEHAHKHTNTVEGLSDPNAEAHAPGRPTDGANNNP